MHFSSKLKDHFESQKWGRSKWKRLREKNLAEFKSRGLQALKRFSERHFTTVFSQSYINLCFIIFSTVTLSDPLIWLKSLLHTFPAAGFESRRSI